MSPPPVASHRLALSACLAGALLLHPEAGPLQPELRAWLALLLQAVGALAVGIGAGRPWVVLTVPLWYLAAGWTTPVLQPSAFVLCCLPWLRGDRHLAMALATVATGEGVLLLTGWDRPVSQAMVACWNAMSGADQGGSVGPALLLARSLGWLTAVGVLRALLRCCWRLAAVTVGLHVLTAALAARLLAWRLSQAEPEPAAASWLLLLPLALAILVPAARAGVPVPVLPWRRRLGWGALVGLVALAPLPGLLGTAGVPQRGSVVLLNEGGLDWDVPVHGSYGAWSGGMFGLLPHYLERAGHAVDVLSWEALWQRPVQPDVLVLINSPRSYDADARERVLGFVRSGGALLVLGDHTNVFGLQDGFNSLLATQGCRFEFDSAYPPGGCWPGNDAVRLPLAMSRPRRGFVAGHAIGASLTVDHRWHVMLEGTRAFGDLGEAANVPGSYLGDYRFQRGEAAGSLCLAARRHLGAGVMLVYGDTSAFQNSPLERTFLGHVLPLFDWLVGGHRRESDWLWLHLATLALAAVGLLVRPGAGPGAAMSAAAVAALACAGQAAVVDTAAQLARLDCRDLVLVDEHWLPNTGHYDAHWNVIAPLSSCACRTGFWTLLTTERVALERVRPAAIVLVAPHRELDASAVDELSRFAAAGGCVVVACGHADRRGVGPLLQRHGIEILGRPLGLVEDRGPARPLTPRFRDAWPLRVTSPHRVVAAAGDDVLAAFVPSGAGGLLAVGDTRFFSCDNVEGTGGSHAGNLALILTMLETFLPRVQAPVRRPAANPEKPS